MRIRSTAIGLGALVCSLSGCTVETAADGAWIETHDTASVAQPIINGTLAADYPEAVTVNMRAATGQGYACSGALIAPKVVLTAGHCIDTMTSWEVVSGTTSRTASGAETYDWNENGSGNVNPNHHDLGLIYLKDSISVKTYPTLSSSAVADGTKAINVGRILNGTLTNKLYQASVQLKSGAAVGFPFDYYANDVIQHGDSGGPVFKDGSHMLLAVNSGANDTTEVLARVDMLTPWISGRVSAHGGTVASTPAPACTAEVETNDSLSAAKTLADNVCGKIASKTDTDWYTASIPVGATMLSMTPDSDARFSVGFVSSGKCTIQVEKQLAVTVNVTGSSKTICVVVSSPSQTVQSYRLSKAKK